MVGPPAQRVVVITDILAGTGNRKATLRTTTSLIKMTSYALIAWSVYQCIPFNIVLTGKSVRTSPTLNPVSFSTVTQNPEGLFGMDEPLFCYFLGLMLTSISGVCGGITFVLGNHV